MLRSGKMLSLAALAIVAVTACPVLAQAFDGPAQDEQLKAVQKQLEQINEILKKSFAEVGKDTKGIRDDIKRIQDDADDTKVKLGLAASKIEALEKQIQAMARELEVLRGKPSEKVSLYPPVDRAVIDEVRAKLAEAEAALKKLDAGPRVSMSPPSVGRMVLINQYSERILFDINNGQRVVTVEPGMTQTVENVPAGMVNYLVVSPTYGIRASRSPMLAANETLTLTVAPQR